eukprot:m.164356 g.164356  ORF g.164356 m.164356 type:complete len:644 (+) comp15233_c0_seq9:178-2109(+)
MTTILLVVVVAFTICSAHAFNFEEKVSFWIAPITTKVMHDGKTPATTTTEIDIAGMLGECERVQIVTSAAFARTNTKLTFAPLQSDSDLPNSYEDVTWSYKQQGYVYAKPSTHYSCIKNILNPNIPPPPPKNQSQICADTPRGQCTTGCPANPKGECGGGKAPPGSCNMCECNHMNTTCNNNKPCAECHPCLEGWYPDPLLDVPSSGIPLIPADFVQPIYVEACIPYSAMPGNYTGTVTLESTTSSGTVTNTIDINFEIWNISIPKLNDTNAFNTAFRFGSDMSAWYPVGTAPLQMWQDWMPFLARHRVPADDIYLESPRPTAEYVELASTGAKWMNMMDAGKKGTIPPGYVDDVIKTLTPLVQNMTELGFIDKMYVYGFDEMPETFNASVYEIFGTIKKAFPQIKTMAVLDWQTFPADLPLDIWVDEYADYGLSNSYLQPTDKEKLRQNWLSSGKGHQFWWYWCIGPSDPHWMNTFIERPGIEARLLYWLTALHTVNGMLYYDVAIWSNQCPKERPCEPVGRINGTALTNFIPATWNGADNVTGGGGANGDGSFTYPGEGGKPLGSIRLSNIADGIEDWELFNKLGATTGAISNAADLIAQIVTNGTNFNDNPLLLENLRRQVKICKTKNLDFILFFLQMVF